MSFCNFLFRSLIVWPKGHSQAPNKIIGQCFLLFWVTFQKESSFSPLLALHFLQNMSTECPNRRQKLIGVVAGSKGERWVPEILYNDANYRIERQRQHSHLSLFFSGNDTEKIYKISRNWVNGREEVVVKKYKFAVLFSLWLKAGFLLSPGTNVLLSLWVRERVFVYIYRRRMPEDRHDHMDAFLLDYICSASTGKHRKNTNQ